MSPLMLAVFASLFLFIAMFIFFSAYTVWYQTRLTFYLRKHRCERWRELEIVPGGTANPFRLLSYIHNDLDTEDENILRFKGRVRFGERVVLVTILVILINAVVSMAVGTRQKI